MSSWLQRLLPAPVSSSRPHRARGCGFRPSESTATPSSQHKLEPIVGVSADVGRAGIYYSSWAA
jgi:hypothetical protein